jgi:hypothetical protein
MSAKSNLSPEDISRPLLPGLTQSFHIWAKKSGWPEKVIDSMSVTYKDGSIVIDYPEENADEIHSLEYGGGGGVYVMPNAVIRPFTYRAASQINDAIAEAALSDIAESGGIWA